MTEIFKKGKVYKWQSNRSIDYYLINSEPIYNKDRDNYSCDIARLNDDGSTLSNPTGYTFNKYDLEKYWKELTEEEVKIGIKKGKFIFNF